MTDVGRVAQLWRYPVKSFRGEQVESLAIGPGGAEGDRVFAVVDPAASKVLTAKLYPDLLLASARLDGDDVVLDLPNGVSVAATDPDVHDAVSSWLDRDLRVQRPPAEGVMPMEMYSGMSDEDTPLFDWPGPEGTWLDLADAHWLTTSSLAAIAAEYPDGNWDVRRFRPSALVETSGDGYVEDDWSTVTIGEVVSSVLMPTMRCSMPSRGQPGIERDKKIGTTIRDAHGNNLGTYASITTAGTLHVGDPVTVD